MMTRCANQTLRVLALAAFVASACASDPADPAERNDDQEDVLPPTAPPPTHGGEDNTFDHDNTGDIDPFDLLRRLEEEGPMEVQARLHSCPKVPYRSMGNLLASRGVDLNATGQFSAGRLWREGDLSLGTANYGARIAESRDMTTATAAKLFDIFVAAAPEIIAAMPTLEACSVGGMAARMFDDQGRCTPDGITCVTGVPATAHHVEQCNHIVNQATTAERGRIIAVATLMAAAHTCE
jgi:hypothetical protein